MKTLTLTLFMMIWPYFLRAQSDAAEQLQLNYEKLLLLRNILSNMQEGYEIINTGYSAVRDITQNNFSIHQEFIAGLKAVNPEVRNYSRVGDIVKIQKDIRKEFRDALNQFSRSDLLSSGEIRYLEQVYDGLEESSLGNVDELLAVIADSDLSMSDDERLESIDRIYAESADKLQFFRSFTARTRVLVLQRARDRRNAADISRLYNP